MYKATKVRYTHIHGAKVEELQKMYNKQNCYAQTLFDKYESGKSELAQLEARLSEHRNSMDYEVSQREKSVKDYENYEAEQELHNEKQQNLLKNASKRGDFDEKRRLNHLIMRDWQTQQLKESKFKTSREMYDGFVSDIYERIHRTEKAIEHLDHENCLTQKQFKEATDKFYELQSDLAKEEALAYIESLNNAKTYAEKMIELYESGTNTTHMVLSKENAERVSKCLLELQEVAASEAGFLLEY